MALDWKYKIPTKFINSFLEVAAKNKSELDGRHVETIGFLIGTKEGNLITATDLIFPKQSGNSALVTDEGNFFCDSIDRETMLNFQQILIR